MYQSNQKSYSTRKEKFWLFISRLEVDKKGRHIKRNGSRRHMRELWDTTIDDITLSQASEQIEKEIECENLLENITLSQAIDLYNPGPADMESNYFVDFDLLAKKEGGSSMPVGRYEHFVNDNDLKDLLNSTENKNTRKNTNWSVTTFNDWRSARMMMTGDQIPDILAFSAEELNFWLSRFVVETRRKDGKAYPPKTLYMLCTGLLRHLRENGVHFNFLDEKNSQFYEFRKTLSARMAELTAQGVGTSTRQAEPISEEAENILWEKGLLGNSTGESMLNTLFFYNCKLFGLRAVDEHKTLSVDQFELGQDQKGKFINFTGRANKTYKGGLYQRHVSAKSIRHHFQGEKVFNIYKEYFDLVVVNSENNRFYRRPLANGENNEVRFSVQPIGVNKLSTIMKNMCDKAGIPGFFSNHSGKRTCATALYQAGVPEQEIMERTGHRSIESVRKYKRPSEEMLRDISNALEPNEPVSKKAKILDGIENPKCGDCKNMFNNCKVYFNL